MGQLKPTIFRYKLVEENKADSQQICGVDLTKNWSYFETKKNVLKDYIKNKVNPVGIVDYEEVEKYDTDKIYYSSTEAMQKPKMIYTKDHLAMMPRDKLVEVAKWYEIVSANKPDWWIRNSIVEEQYKYIEANTETTNIENTNKIQKAKIKNPADTFQEKLEEVSNKIIEG